MSVFIMIGRERCIFSVGARESNRLSIVDKSLVEVNMSLSEGDILAEGEVLAYYCDFFLFVLWFFLNGRCEVLKYWRSSYLFDWGLREAGVLFPLSLDVFFLHFFFHVKDFCIYLTRVTSSIKRRKDHASQSGWVSLLLHFIRPETSGLCGQELVFTKRRWWLSWDAFFRKAQVFQTQFLHLIYNSGMAGVTVV